MLLLASVTSGSGSIRYERVMPPSPDDDHFIIPPFTPRHVFTDIDDIYASPPKLREIRDAMKDVVEQSAAAQ